jgi:hypothetical protein
MGIGSKLGFGKKEPYKAPREVAVLRMKIEAESRENFPHLARYKELVREADQVFRHLDAEVAKKKYAEEAGKLSEDIKQKLDALAGRIRKNVREAAVEAAGGSGDSKMDYLAQKSLRDSAKTVFTEFLEGHVLFISTCRDCTQDCTDDITTAALSMMRNLTVLKDEYFSKYIGDEEIRGLRDRTREKVTELNSAFQLHKTTMRDRAAASVAERHLVRLQAETQGWSAD